MQIKSLEGVPVAKIADTFNAAFADYLVPIQLTEKALRDKMVSENTSLAHSAGVFDDGRLVGFILIGIGDGVAYNGGTGVIPEFRGKNLTRRMYDFLLPLLADHGIRNHILEVITENHRAVPVYEKIGFAKTRTVTCFKGKIKNSASMAELREMAFNQIDLSFFDFQPTYQNHPDAVKRLAHQQQTIGAFLDEKLVGYIVFDRESGRVKLFAVAHEFRRNGIGHQLFFTAQKLVGDKMLSLINVDDADASIAFLSAIGLEPTVGQYEMRYTFIESAPGVW